MQIVIEAYLRGARVATGAVAIIDAFRAFITAVGGAATDCNNGSGRAVYVSPTQHRSVCGLAACAP